jgi:hypothetical protein
MDSKYTKQIHAPFFVAETMTDAESPLCEMFHGAFLHTVYPSKIKDGEKVKEYQIERIPAIAIIGKEDYGIRFYGMLLATKSRH